MLTIMQTPNSVNSLQLVATCVGIPMWKWERYMEGTTKANGSKIRKLIKEHLPDLYASLELSFYNPNEYSCVKKKGLLVYVHSMTEYFIKYD